MIGSVLESRAYRLMLVVGTLLAYESIANVQKHHVVFYYHLHLKIELLAIVESRRDRTHDESLKDLIEVLPPGGNHILVVLRKEKSYRGVSFTLLGDVVLDLDHSSAIETSRGE